MTAGNDIYNLDKPQYRRPGSQQREQWNVPSINSDITKEIDVLLNYKPQHYDTMKSGRTETQNRNRPPSAFN